MYVGLSSRIAMKPVVNYLISAVAMCLLWHLDSSVGDEIQEEPEG